MHFSILLVGAGKERCRVSKNSHVWILISDIFDIARLFIARLPASCVFNIFWWDFTRKDKAGRNPYRIGQEQLGNIETLRK